MKEVTIFGINTTKKQIWNALWQNFLYGFLGGALPSAVSSHNDYAVGISVVLFYTVLSLILNREPYKTRLGRFIIFPVATSLGFFLSYKLITTFL